MPTVTEKLLKLNEKFPKRTDYKFLYRKRADLSRKYSTVQMYFIIYDEERGHSLMVWNPHRRGYNWRAKEWYEWMQAKGFEIFADAVLDSINIKSQADWLVREFVGFHGDTYEPTQKQLPDNKGRKSGVHRRTAKSIRN